jgi:hypothetical protein
MDHKGSVFHFNFLSRSQQVTSYEMATHTQQQNPHRDWLDYFNMVPLRNWIEIQGRFDECNQFYSLVSLSPKTSKIPTMQQVLFSG